MPIPTQTDRFRALAHIVANPADHRPQARRFAWLILKSARGQTVLQHRLRPAQSAPGSQGDAA